MAEEIITLTPGSSDEKRERFYNTTYYPIKPGKIIKWSHPDNIPHEIEILVRIMLRVKIIKSILKILFHLNLKKMVSIHFNLLNIIG